MKLLYIDPGTGSMLFAVLIGIIGALGYIFKSWLLKLKFLLSGGKSGEINKTSIPILIFSEGKRYWNIFKPICRELDKHDVEVVYMTSSKDDPALNEEFTHIKTQFIGEANRAFAKLNFINADIVLATTPGLDVFQWKRSKNVKCYVHIPHMANDVSLYRMFGLDYYDAVLVSGDYQKEEIRALEKLRSLPKKEIVKVGIPYMDDMFERLKGAKKEDAENKTVLLAPSWGKNSILNVYRETIIDALIETGYNLIIRPHPQSFVSEAELMNTLIEKYPETEQLEWNRDGDNFDVLNRSDILISDFSGVIFDFSLVFDKPFIYAHTDFDKGVYDAWWLEEEPWTFDVLPRLGAELTKDGINNIKELIDDCISNPSYAESRDEARNETWAHIGKGAENTSNYLINKLKEINNTEKQA